MTTVPVCKSPGTMLEIVTLMPVGVLVIARVPAEKTLLALAVCDVKLAPEPTTTATASVRPPPLKKYLEAQWTEPKFEPLHLNPPIVPHSPRAPLGLVPRRLVDECHLDPAIHRTGRESQAGPETHSVLL